MATPVVGHGRRKGSLRSTPEVTIQSPLRSGQVAILSDADWKRMCGNVKEREEGKVQLKNDREALHVKSRSIVKNWENTIQGQRLKKVQARKIREENEELDRIEVDIKEAKFQAERRREAIEQAKTLLYYQTDRVKQFHGAMLLSEVLLERDKQVEYKAGRHEAIMCQDAKFFKAQSAEREASIRKDIEAGENRAREKDAIAKFQITQAATKSQLKAKDREAALKEQDHLDEEVREFHKHQREIEAQACEEKLDHRKALDEVLKQKRERNKAEEKIRKEQEDELKVFAEAKKKMSQLRKQREEKLFCEFQTHQQHMCDLLHSQMSQATSNEDERIAKTVAEQDAKKEAEERAKQLQFLEAAQSIDRHTREQIADKERKRVEQQTMDAELLRQRITQDNKFHSQQLEKHRKAAKEAQERQEFLNLQVSELAVRKETSAQEEKAYNQRNMELLKVEELQFQQYANDVINEVASRGAPTKPLVKAAKAGAGGGHGCVFIGKEGIRPSYQTLDCTGVELPSYTQQPAAVQTNTEKRMGFTW